MNEFERRTSNWEAGGEAIITGYAVVFEQRTVLYKDPDTGIEYGEIIDRHALDGADMGDVVLKYNHQGRVLARTRNNTLQLSIDNHGLMIRADLSKSDEAKEFYKDVRSGLLDKMSFAFQIERESYDRTTNTRRILAISCIRDVSIVDFPAYDQTQVSARSRFEVFAEPDRTTYRIAQVSRVHTEMRTRIESMGFRDDESAEDYANSAGSGMLYMGTTPWLRRTPEDGLDPLKHQILVLRDKMRQQNGSADLSGALELRNELEDLERRLKDVLQARAKLRTDIARGLIGKPLQESNTMKTKENNMTETRAFFENIIETRGAATTGTMTKMIPETVMDNFIREQAPGAFLQAASKTAISHNGTLKLPIATLQPIAEHPENEEIEDAGYVPGTLTISHKEYCYKTGYSDLGYKLSAQNLERIIRDTIMASMLKKMDGICLDAVAALEYVKNTNAVELSAAPAYADFVQLASYLGSDFLNSAKWYMSPGTYFS